MKFFPITSNFFDTLFWTGLITLFILFESPITSKEALSSGLSMPPEGYSYMYVYTIIAIMYILSALLYINKYRLYAWISIAPLYFLAIPTLATQTYNGVLSSYAWIAISFALSLSLIHIFVHSYLASYQIPKTSSWFNLNKLSKIKNWYYHICSIHEFYTHRYLHYILYAQAAFLIFTLRLPATTITSPPMVGSYICPSWFQSCHEWYILTLPPQGYSYVILTSILMLLLGGSIYATAHKKYTVSHLCLILPTLWQLFLAGFLTFDDYYYGHVMLYIIIINCIVLFLPNKITTLGWALMLTYILSIASKITDSWISGSAFSSLHLGLPIIGHHFSQIAAWLVLFLEGIVVWFLLSPYIMLRYLALASFIGFHLYSIAMIQYLFPLVAIVVLLIVFGPIYTKLNFTHSKKSTYILVAFTTLAIVGQSIALLTPGDSRITHEGKRYGLHMFDANISCFSTVTYHYHNDTQKTLTQEIIRLGYCNPYYQWYPLKQKCLHQNNIKNITLSLDTSLNGGPYYRTVEKVPVCNTEYHPLEHNSWIQYDYEEMQTIPHQSQHKAGIL